MKVFVLGAGASKASQHAENLSEGMKAPLMRELFLDRYYPFAKEVGLPANKFAELRTLAGDNVEIYLTERWEEIQKHQSRQFQEAEKRLFGKIVFYIWRLLLAVSTSYNFDEKNTYKLLLEKILNSNEDHGFINFNYDTLLDKAIKDAYGIYFSSLDDYFSFDYIKPHGSVNWLMSNGQTEIDRNFSGDFFLEPRYDMASNLMFTGEPIPYANIRVIDPKDPNLDEIRLRSIIQTHFGQRYFYPLVFIPLTTKLYSSVTDFNERIMQKGNEIMEKATEIYLIGYSASDQIIRDMLHYAPKWTKLHVVGRESSGKILKDLYDEFEGELIHGDIYSEGFTKFVSEL
jgi:hypothetical protein